MNNVLDLKGTYVRDYVKGDGTNVRDHPRATAQGKMPDADLIERHNLLHMWYSRSLGGKSRMTPEQIEEMHENIVDEMEARGMTHDSPLDKGDSKLQ